MRAVCMAIVWLATLVFDTAPVRVPASQPVAVRKPALPEPASSFGAVACDGWLYVYGGHIVRTHKYSTASVSGKFHRLRLDGGTEWEKLPSGPGLQGMNLATWRGKIYRLGGMEPRNSPDEPEDNYSVAEAACYDPKLKKWEALPPMPQARSSHDVAVVQDQLFVLGGWWMKGGRDIEWLEHMDVLDLAAGQASWKSVPQPFKRRALIATVFKGRIYIIGGFTEDDEASRVDIYDPRERTWSRGPDLPGPDRNGFAPAACVNAEHLYVSVADGSFLRLNAQGDSWERIASTTPRIVHRLVPFGPEVLVIGGAANRENFDLIEAVRVGTGAGDRGH